ncbi:MAG TPA: hypothetical protein VHG33_05355, partial [Woeseiaceae bacterium]|nr:hypothetical protein [Woeseiaceae bacterium]
MNDRDDRRQDSDPDPLLRAARQLPQGIAPQRDLWPGIERAISAPPSRTWDWNRITAQAAAVLLLVGGSSAVTWLAVEGNEKPAVQPVATTQPLEFETVAGR